MNDIIIYLFLVALGFFLGALTVTITGSFNRRKQDETRSGTVEPKPSSETPARQPLEMQPGPDIPDAVANPGEMRAAQVDSIPPAPAPAAAPVAPAPGQKPQKGFVAPPAVDMVQEINDILNEMSLHGEPNAARIKLIPDPSLGVSVFVSGQRFGGIAEVADPEIRKTLQMAVRVWESRRVPGVTK